MLTFTTFAVFAAPLVVASAIAAIRFGRATRLQALLGLIWAVYVGATLYFTVFPIPPAGEGPMHYAAIDFIDTNIRPVGYFDLLNMVMFMPFGFGIWWVHPIHRLRTAIAAGFAHSLILETIQFAVGYRARFPYRAVDPADLFYNTLGATLGALVFLAMIPTLADLPLPGVKHLLAEICNRARTKCPPTAQVPT